LKQQAAALAIGSFVLDADDVIRMMPPVWAKLRSMELVH
jgi:hypothetical protein